MDIPGTLAENCPESKSVVDTIEGRVNDWQCGGWSRTGAIEQAYDRLFVNAGDFIHDTTANTITQLGDKGVELK